MQATRSARRCVAAAAAALAAVALGCESAKPIAGDIAYDLNPVGETDLVVQAVDVHGPYLDASVAGRREQLRVLAPADDADCAAVLRPETPVRYAKSGVFGRLERDGTVCDLAGVASLAEWRDRLARRRGGVVPRGTARYEPFFRDDAVLLLRGRFPLAARIGIPAGYDLVALVPNDAPCRAAAERGETSIEYRSAGPEPFRLLAGDDACVVTGFAIPPAPK